MSNLEGSVASSDTTLLAERITSNENKVQFNNQSINQLFTKIDSFEAKVNADTEKIVEHMDKSFKAITDSMNSNPLSLGN